MAYERIGVHATNADDGGVNLADSVELVFGSGTDINDPTVGDITMAWDGTDFDVTQSTANSSIKWGVSGAGIDHVWYGDTVAADLTWDQSADSLILGDAANLVFGTGSDVTIAWDGTDLDVTAAADNSVIRWGATGNSFDMWFYGSISDNYALIDTSANTLSLEGSMRAGGFNAVPSRFELNWIAGKEGLVDLNATANTDLIDSRFEVLGTNASADDITYYAEGGLKLETDGTDGDEIIILPHLDTSQSVWTETTWGTDKETAWECDITTGSAITNCIIWAGLKLTNTEVTATDNDAAFFRYENGVQSGVWECISAIGGSDDEHASSVTVAVDTRYHLKIVIASDRTAKFFINGALAETSAALTNTVDLIPYIGVATDGAAEAKHMYVHGQAISRTIG